MRAVRLCASILVLLLLLAAAPPASAANRIAIDGKFGDWQGAEGVQVRQPGGYGLIRFLWARDAGDPYLYLMLEEMVRPSWALRRPVRFTVNLDTNDDGRYNSAADRAIQVDFDPGSAQSADASVEVRAGGRRIAGGRARGYESEKGDARVELGVRMSDLGISDHQPFRMYATSDDSRLPSATVHVSPVPTLEPPAVALLVLLAGTIVWKRGGWTCQS